MRSRTPDPGSLDRRFVRRLLDGDEQAFDRLFEELVPRLFRIVLARVDGREDLAEELVQRALAQGMRKLHTFRGEARLLTWLSTIALREAGRTLRAEQRGLQAVSLTETPEIRTALELLESEEDSPERSLQRAEVKRLVHEVLARLPLRYAEALELKYLEDLSVKEIAKRLGTGPVSVQSVLSRARQAFREAFSEIAAGAGLFGSESSTERSNRGGLSPDGTRGAT